MISPLVIRLPLIMLLYHGAYFCAAAATFEIPQRQNGTPTIGLRLEGDIVAGDAQKLLDFYHAYGIAASPVYLRSRGGDVNEAMEIGKIVRRLRLDTNAPVWDTGRSPVETIKLENKEDGICASACFLVYAAGASRFGNYIGLHRPYLSEESAQFLSDVEYVALQKRTEIAIRAYLTDMEVDQYWIDRMFATNSGEVFIPSWVEADNKVRHLMGIVPTLEEVTLSKCHYNLEADQKFQKFVDEQEGKFSQKQIQEMKMNFKINDNIFECKRYVLDEMRNAAFERENEPITETVCGNIPHLNQNERSEIQSLRTKGRSLTQEEKFEIIQLYVRDKEYQNCKKQNIYKLITSSISRYSEDSKKS